MKQFPTSVLFFGPSKWIIASNKWSNDVLPMCPYKYSHLSDCTLYIKYSRKKIWNQWKDTITTATLQNCCGLLGSNLPYTTQPQLQLLHNNPVMVCWQILTLHSQIPFGAQLLNGKLAASNLTSHSVNIRSSRGVTSKNTAPMLGWRM